jgi:imidazolonepropionase
VTEPRPDALPGDPRGATLAIVGAVEVLRPPAYGLPYLRHDRASDLRLDPSPIAVAGRRIAGFEDAEAAAVRIDASGCAVLPGLVDCHTHLPFAGWRAEEYELKVTGVPYEEVARRGGGIASSARAFAEASDDEVLAQARGLVGEMLAHGTTAYESKTGYGLSVEAEARAARLGRELGADRVTGLFAHAVPSGYTADAWMDEVDELAAACDVDALDIYVESVAFANEHLERLGAIAAREGVALRAHVEQFNANRSVPVALAANARSVDHLACLHPDDIAPLAQSECAAVLLPGAEFISAERTPPARELVEAGAICALATDCNPGTSPIVSLPVIVGLAVRRYGWSALEALLACTLNAAWVLDLSEEIGSLEVGKRADLVLLDGPIAHVPYRFGRNPVSLVVRGGEVAWVRPDAAWRIAA